MNCSKPTLPHGIASVKPDSGQEENPSAAAMQSEHGYFQRRNTRQRQLILEQLQAVTSHPTAVELYELVRRRLPKISLGTVYRNLDLLTRMGMVQKLEYSSGDARFDANTAPHDHLRCVRCGRVDDTMAPPLDLARPVDDDLHGYQVIGHRLEYLGICPRCRQTSACVWPRRQTAFQAASPQFQENQNMLKANIQEALNNQINGEIASTYLYLSMAAYFESKNFHGLAKWMEVQAREEWSHAMKIFGHVNARNGRVVLKQIDAPVSEWKSPLDVFEHTLAHELKVTEKVHALVKLADSECDYATRAFLEWFVSEQVEEEAQTTNIVEKLRLMGDGHIGLFILDAELGKRAAE